MRLLPIILAERRVPPLFFSRKAVWSNYLRRPPMRSRQTAFRFCRKILICSLQFFPVCADIFHYLLESFCYKLSNACYKLCNMYYKLCNIYSKPLNKKYHIWREKLSAQTGKNSTGLVKNILLKIFAVTYERRYCKEENKRLFAIFANFKRNR